MTPVLALAIGLAIGAVTARAAALVGVRLGLLDHPSAIKPHGRPIPFTGGSAILVTVLAIAPFAALNGLVLAGAALAWLVGLIDDIRGLDPWTKLVSPIPALVLGVMSIELGLIERVLAVAAGVVLLNVFNVIDGLDGLAGGTAALMLGVFAFGTDPFAGLAAATLGATLGFLLFNLPPARIFLGDEGTLLLGYILWLLPLGWLAESGAQRVLPLWALVWLFPIVNSGYVLFARLRSRRPLLRGDRSHLYDDLNRRFGLRRTLAVCWGISVVGLICVLALARAS